MILLILLSTIFLLIQCCDTTHVVAIFWLSRALLNHSYSRIWKRSPSKIEKRNGRENGLSWNTNFFWRGGGIIAIALSNPLNLDKCHCKCVVHITLTEKNSSWDFCALCSCICFLLFKSQLCKTISSTRFWESISKWSRVPPFFLCIFKEPLRFFWGGGGSESLFVRLFPNIKMIVI